MELRPILSALRRHKTMAILIVMQIALCYAIICNALFLIGNRLEHMHRPSGVDEDRIVVVQLLGLSQDQNAAAVTRSDIAALQALPGVAAASATNQVPFGSGFSSDSVSLQKDQEQPNLSASSYMGGPQFIDAMGLKLIAGRRFQPDEFIEWEAFNAPNSEITIPAVIITRAMAERLFPGERAVGKSIYTTLGDAPIRIVGIVDRLVRAQDSGAINAAYEYSMLFPMHVPYTAPAKYILKVDDPAQRQEILKTAAMTLLRNGPDRILVDESTKTLRELRNDYYQRDKAMAGILIVVCAALLVVTALGIVGVASFWVQQRTRQIGIRRALGATRRQILHYFQLENFILASLGVVLGMLFAHTINLLLMSRYELPRLPLWYLPVGAVTLWLLGQISVLGPALRASAVPPAIATRSI